MVVESSCGLARRSCSFNESKHTKGTVACRSGCCRATHVSAAPTRIDRVDTRTALSPFFCENLSSLIQNRFGKIIATIWNILLGISFKKGDLRCEFINATRRRRWSCELMSTNKFFQQIKYVRLAPSNDVLVMLRKIRQLP